VLPFQRPGGRQRQAAWLEIVDQAAPATRAFDTTKEPRLQYALRVKLHVVDGTYELFRAFFSWPSETGLGGREVGACRGLARSFLRLTRSDDVSHLACAFDHRIESFRNALFDGYKTGEGI
jgi:5'-3' exonuclease